MPLANEKSVALRVLQNTVQEKFRLLQDRDGHEYVCIPPSVWINIKKQVNELTKEIEPCHQQK